MEQRRKLCERVLKVTETFQALPWYWRVWYILKARYYVMCYKHNRLYRAVLLLLSPTHRKPIE